MYFLGGGWCRTGESCLLATQLDRVHQRESLVGESAFKAILELTKGGLDHGKANGLSKKGTKSS